MSDEAIQVGDRVEWLMESGRLWLKGKVYRVVALGANGDPWVATEKEGQPFLTRASLLINDRNWRRLPEHGVEIGRWYQVGSDANDPHFRRAISVEDDHVSYEWRYVNGGEGTAGMSAQHWRFYIGEGAQMEPATPPWEQPQSETKSYPLVEVVERPAPRPACAPGCSPANVCDRPGCLAREHLNADAAAARVTALYMRAPEADLTEFSQPHAPRYAFAFGRRAWR